MSIGSRIRNARQEKGLSQEELAKAIGATKSAISRYEAGKRMPNLGQIQAIAAALDGDVVYLVCGQTTTEFQSGILIQAEAEAKAEFEKLQLEFQSRSFDERVSISSALIHLFKLFGRFNPIGHQKAIERVEELTEIPKYQRHTSTDATESPPASQEGTDIAETEKAPSETPQRPQEDET